MDAKSENRRSLVPKQNARSSIPLVINKEGRQSLFQKQSKESLRGDSRPSLGRNAYSDGLASLAVNSGQDRISRAVSPTPSVTSSNSDGASRIPRPSSAMGVFSKARQPISLTDAYRMAEAEEDRLTSPRTLRLSPAPVDGSPSPAPRPRPVSRGSDGRQMRHAENTSRYSTAPRRASQIPPCSNVHAAANDTVQSADSLSSTSSFDRRFSEFAEEQSPSNKSRISEASRLTKRASTNSLSNSPQSQPFSKGHVPKGWVAHLLAREERGSPIIDRRHSAYAGDVPLPSVEDDVRPQEPTPPSSRPASAEALDPSPNKSYAWQVDEDFTAGDLSVSDSPRISSIGLGARAGGNNKLEEIRRREFAQRIAERHQDLDSRHKNTKLDEIEHLEQQLDQLATVQTEDATQKKNQKLDEIIEREKNFMSKKAIASNRLDDIRERNSMSMSRSLSPDVPLKPSTTLERKQESAQTNQTTSTPAKAPPTHPDEDGERIPNTPVTIFRGGNRKVSGDETTAPVKGHRETPQMRNNSTHARSDSRDLLRQLARAASASPVPSDKPDSCETKKAADEAVEANDDQARRFSLADPLTVEATTNVPFAGSASPRRASSTDSTKEKRSSRALSDTDPTDRIEAEMKLFALGDNQSEWGSVRAPSVGPPSEDDDDGDDENLAEETPRAIKYDPLSMPTPKVVGAYVETPAMTKVEERLGADVGQNETLSSTANKGTVVSRRVSTNSDRSRSRPRSKLYVTETHEESGTTTSTAIEPQGMVVTCQQPGLRRRRTRSLPRSRGPLMNSVKPPSVRDDLLEIQRTYQIEDSTLDDFEHLLSGSKVQWEPPGDLDRLLSGITNKRLEIEANPDRDNSELERYNRMSKTLTDGLIGIRTAKQGIERLEGNLANVDQPTHSQTENVKPENRIKVEEVLASMTAPVEAINSTSGLANENLSVQAVQTATYIQFPLPPLYRRKPFRFTFLGTILILLSVWYLAESAMCAQYCRPESCSPSHGPCIWEPSDPFWGYAIPVKLDQWITNGEGRRLYEELAEDGSDKYLDFWDFVTGRDIRDVNIGSLDFLGKRQHRRRLRKHGLTKSTTTSPEEEAKWDAIHEARLAIERKREMREAGYEVDDDMETFEADEAI